jgi:phosphatidylinositol alpha-1,6-mannosyltransferase
MTPRVLVLAPDFPPASGGVQTLVHRVVAGWTRAEPIVVAGSSPGARAFDAQQPFAVHRVPGGLPAPGRSLLLNAAGLARALRCRPDAVLSTHIVAAPAAAVLRRVAGAGWVQYVHAKEVPRRPALARFAVGRADVTLAVSSYSAELVHAAGGDVARLRIVHPGVDLPDAIERVPPKRPTVVVVARLADRYKGHDVLLGAIARVREDVPDVRLVVIGDGPLRGEYADLAASLGISPAVDFVGAVDDAERDSLLDQASVFAMPSRLEPDGSGEGFGIVYLEAASRGLPVVAGNVGGARDAVLDGVTGLLVDPTSSDEVAVALTRLLRDPDTATRYGEAGAARAREHTWESVARQVEDALLGVTRRRA